MNRRPLFVPMLATILLWLAFASFVALTATQLPERVATHFGASGEANGWMTRGGHVQFTLIMGLIVPGAFLGIFALIRRFQGRSLNIPHKDYWLAPERRQQTFDFIQRQGFWFAALLIAFFAAIHESILVANRHTPALLSLSHVGWIVGGFATAAIAWALLFVGHFFRRPA